MDLLRPYLIPLTHSLPLPLVRLGHSLLGPACYTQLLLHLDIRPSSPCFSLAVSKLLGLGIIALASVVKVPQILKLARARSAAGVSLLACALETAAYLVTLAYSARQGFPFTSYGETALIAVQDLVVCALVVGYGGLMPGGGGGLLGAGVGVGVVGVMWALMDPRVVDGGVLKGLQAMAGVVGVASKVPQIWTVWREGGTGQLSAFGVFTYLMGSLSRIFTTLQEVDDPLILYGFVAGFALNAVLAAQMVYYWRSPATARHAAELVGEKPREMASAAAAVGSGSRSTGVDKAKGNKGPSTRRRG